ACAAPATTRCQSCGALSCATHLQSVYVSHGRGGAYELRCAPCYASAMESKALNMVIGICLIVVVLIIILVIVLQSQRAKGPKKDTTQGPASIVVVDSGAEPAAAEAEAFEPTTLRNDGGKARIAPRAEGVPRASRAVPRRAPRGRRGNPHATRPARSNRERRYRRRSLSIRYGSRIDGASAAAIQRLKPTSRVPIASSRNAHER